MDVRKFKRITNVIVIVLIIILIMSILILSLNHSKEPINNEKSNSLKQGWKYKIEGENSGIYKDIELPYTVDKNIRGNRIYLKGTLPSNFIMGATLLIRTSQQFITIYIDKEEVYNYGYTNKRYFGKSPGSSWHFIRLPMDFMDKEIEIVLKSPYNDYSTHINEIYFGSKSSHIFRILTTYGISTMIGLVLSLVGISVAVIYLVLYKFSGQCLNILYLSFFSMTVGIWVVSESRLIAFFYNNPFFICMLGLISLYMMPIPLLFYILKTYLPAKDRLIKYAAIAHIIFLFIATILQFLNIFDLIELLTIFHIMILVDIVVIFLMIISELRNNKKYIKFLLYGVSILGSAAILDVILYYLNPNGNAAFFSQIGLLFFTITMAISAGKYFSDLTYVEASNDALKQLAYKDILTNIGNRASFEKDFELLYNNIEMLKYPAIVISDVNNLKYINDKFGHKEGDKVIIKSSYMIQSAFDKIGNSYRIGGDEFAVLIKSTDNDIIKECIMQLEIMIEEHDKKTPEYKISLAIGYAFYDKLTDKSSNDMFIRADTEMYKNKAMKKSNF